MSTATISAIPAAEYHADYGSVSKSMLWKFRERVSSFHREYILGEVPPESSTPAMDLGTLAHAALLEPHKLATHFVEYPREVLAKNGATSTNAAKEFREAQESIGRTVLKAREFDIVSRMVESVKAATGTMLAVPAEIEQTIRWEDADTGIRCKCRPDFYLPKAGAPSYVLDLKTTDNASPDAFRRRCEQFGYWLQDAHYSAGVAELTGNVPIFLFVVVETEWPWQCAVYQLSAAQRELSADKRRTLLESLDLRTATNNWNDDWQGVVNTLELKPWAFE